MCSFLAVQIKKGRVMMPRPEMIMTLSKVMIAAAWTDGSITNEEINSLKDLLFHLPGMTAHDWAELEIYLETPVGPEERARLVVSCNRRFPPQRSRAGGPALKDVVQADGNVLTRKVVFNEINRN
jgi:hypothetical protein